MHEFCFSCLIMLIFFVILVVQIMTKKTKLYNFVGKQKTTVQI